MKFYPKIQESNFSDNASERQWGFGAHQLVEAEMMYEHEGQVVWRRTRVQMVRSKRYNFRSKRYNFRSNRSANNFHDVAWVSVEQRRHDGFTVWASSKGSWRTTKFEACNFKSVVRVSLTRWVASVLSAFSRSNCRWRERARRKGGSAARSRKKKRLPLFFLSSFF